MIVLPVVEKSIQIDVEHPQLILSNTAESSLWKPQGWYLPSGWQGIFSEFVFAIYALEEEITSVRYAKGTLQVSVDGNPLFTIPSKWMSQGLAKQSAMTCLYCGKYGVRRKLETGLPPLCMPHYTDF